MTHCDHIEIRPMSRVKAFALYAACFFSCVLGSPFVGLSAQETLAANLNFAVIGSVEGSAFLVWAAFAYLSPFAQLAHSLEVFAFRTVAPWLVFYMFLFYATAFLYNFTDEAEYEEEEHAVFVAMMHAFEANVSAPVYEQLKTQLGDPDAALWRNWDFAGCCYYTWTLMTTVGYGSFGPKTDSGKIFTIVFLLISLPLFGYLLANCGASFIEATLGWWLSKDDVRLRAKLLESLATVRTRQAPSGSFGRSIAESARVALSVTYDERLPLTRRKVRGLISEVDDGDGVLNDVELAKLADLIVEQRDRNTAFILVLSMSVFCVFILPFALPPMLGWSHLEYID